MCDAKVQYVYDLTVSSTKEEDDGTYDPMVYAVAEFEPAQDALGFGAACSESPLVGVESTGAETYLSQPIKEEPIRLNSTAMRGAVGGAHVLGGWLLVLVTP